MKKVFSPASRFSGVLTGKCSVKRMIRLVMGVKGVNTIFIQHNFYAAQVSDSIDADTLELSTVSTGETTSLSGNSPP